MSTTRRTRNSRTLGRKPPASSPHGGIYAIDQARGYQSAYDDSANLPREDTNTTTRRLPKLLLDADWERADVNGESGPLHENTSAVFRTYINLTAEELAAGNIRLRFGMIDDDVWVYVNGHLVGESHDCQASPGFDIRKFVHAGDNSIAGWSITAMARAVSTKV